jgi:hypothetical protein
LHGAEEARESHDAAGAGLIMEGHGALLVVVQGALFFH